MEKDSDKNRVSKGVDVRSWWFPEVVAVRACWGVLWVAAWPGLGELSSLGDFLGRPWSDADSLMCFSWRGD